MIQADFAARVLDYFNLRVTLENGLPAQHVTDKPDENIKIRRELARRIRHARAGAPRGAVLRPPSAPSSGGFF